MQLQANSPLPGQKRLRRGDVAHLALNIVLPIVAVVLVASHLTEFAIAVVILSKWRMFAVSPRHWFANLRSNTVDIMVGVSSIVLMYMAGELLLDSGRTLAVQAFWGLWYMFWLVVVKPRSDHASVAAQAVIGQFFGLVTLFWFADRLPETVVVVFAWLIGVLAARHFFSSYEEPMGRAVSFVWGLVVAQLAWIMNRWLVVYAIAGVVQVPQISLVVTALSYALVSLYQLQHTERLRRQHTVQFSVFVCAILVLVIFFTDWRGAL